MSPITLIIRPYYAPGTGKRAHGQFETRLGDRLICISRQPLLDAARVLAAEGVDPATPIAVRHESAEYDSLRSTLGFAAGLTIEENEKVGPRLARWKAFSRSDVRAPVRLFGEPASRSTPTLEIAESAPRPVPLSTPTTIRGALS
jgi:hypothetical protein